MVPSSSRGAFGPRQNCGMTATVSKPGQSIKAVNAIAALGQESFKSTLVDFTESMNENQITKMTIKQSRELILKACKNGDLRSIKRIPVMKQFNGLDLVNFQALNDPSGMSPLHLACQEGHVAIVELLIRKLSADVDLQNYLGETPLHLACREGHKGCIERLLLAQAKTKIRNKQQGNTPLHVLALANHQRNQETVISDTIKLTMNSQNIDRSQKKEAERFDTNPSDQRQDTNDFADNSPKLSNARKSLIELILPFAEESKNIANHNGVLPWELAADSQVSVLLKPKIDDGIVTASQIQGQSTHHHNQSDARSTSAMTRNHTTKINQDKNGIEVQQVSDAEVAKIFTFYQENGDHQPEQQFTFQAPYCCPGDVYMTTSSKESTAKDRTVYPMKKPDGLKHKDFLNEDIERIESPHDATDQLLDGGDP